MNYRHAFHAGNFADCMKHALLVWLLRALHRKPAPVFVLDTHAGAGRYDLHGPHATRTGESQAGIARLLASTSDAGPLSEYVTLVQDLRTNAPETYPGSPLLIHALLRPDDRLACCELHPDDHADLRRLFASDPLVSVHRRDAWEAIGALLPPKQKRALVLIDPPYEAQDEFTRLLAALTAATIRMPAAVIAAWYPIKTRRQARAFHDGVRASRIRDTVAAELLLRDPTDPARLNGCGLLVVNPPFRFEPEADTLLHALLAGLDVTEPGAAAHVERLTDE